MSIQDLFKIEHAPSGVSCRKSLDMSDMKTETVDRDEEANDELIVGENACAAMERAPRRR